MGGCFSSLLSVRCIKKCHNKGADVIPQGFNEVLCVMNSHRHSRSRCIKIISFEWRACSEWRRSKDLARAGPRGPSACGGVCAVDVLFRAVGGCASISCLLSTAALVELTKVCPGSCASQSSALYGRVPSLLKK